MLSEEVVVALALGIPSLVAAILALFVAYLTYRKAADTRVDRLAPWLPIMLAGVLPSSAPSALPTHAQTPRRGYDSSSEESARAAMPPLNQTMPARPVHHDVDVPSWRLLSRSTASSTQQQPHHQIATPSMSNSVNYGGAASWDPGYYQPHPHPHSDFHYQMGPVGPPGTRAGPGNMHLDERGFA